MNAKDAKDLRLFLSRNTYRSGRQLVQEAGQDGASRPFVEYALRLRVNRKTRRRMVHVRNALNITETPVRKPPVWFSVFQKEVYQLWRSHRPMAAPRLTVQSDLRLLVTRQTRRILGRGGLVKHTTIPLQALAATYFLGVHERHRIMVLDGPHQYQIRCCTQRCKNHLLRKTHLNAGSGVTKSPTYVVVQKGMRTMDKKPGPGYP